MAEVVLENIVNRYGDVVAVNDVSLTINAGAVLCLVGESGSGKTTTAKMIAGLRPPTSGRMLYKGQHVPDLKGEQLAEFRNADDSARGYGLCQRRGCFRAGETGHGHAHCRRRRRPVQGRLSSRPVAETCQ